MIVETEVGVAIGAIITTAGTIAMVVAEEVGLVAVEINSSAEINAGMTLVDLVEEMISSSSIIKEEEEVKGEE